jgi:hypothetical protein
MPTTINDDRRLTHHVARHVITEMVSLAMPSLFPEP